MSGSSLTVYRTLAWNETDAAGHNHFSAALRWLEESEHAFYRALGLGLDFVDRIPRVKVQVEYFHRLYFGQELRIDLRVKTVGRSSATFEFEIHDPEGNRAVAGEYVVVHVAATDGGSEPWPVSVQEALERGDHLQLREEVSVLPT